MRVDLYFISEDQEQKFQKGKRLYGILFRFPTIS